MSSQFTRTPLQICVTAAPGGKGSEGASAAQSTSLAKAVRRHAADRVTTKSAAALALAVEHTVSANEAMIDGDVVAGTLHAVAAAAQFKAGVAGMELAKKLRKGASAPESTQNPKQKEKG